MAVFLHSNVSFNLNVFLITVRTRTTTRYKNTAALLTGDSQPSDHVHGLIGVLLAFHTGSMRIKPTTEITGTIGG